MKIGADRRYATSTAARTHHIRAAGTRRATRPRAPRPAAAIVLGTAAATIIGSLDRRRPLGAIARAGLVTLLAGLAVVTILVPQGTRLDRSALEADTRGATCVAADAPSLLLETTALQRDLRNGCPLVLDPTGTSYDTDRGRLAAGSVGASRQGAIGYQAAMVRYYGGSEAAMFIQSTTDGLTAATLTAIRRTLALTLQHGDVTDRVRAIGMRP
jgi:alpha-1,2-mannosyltransferase